MTFIMPDINQALVKSNISVIKKDVWIARACLALTTIGLIGVGLAVDLLELAVALVIYIQHPIWLHGPHQEPTCAIVRKRESRFTVWSHVVCTEYDHVGCVAVEHTHV